MIELIIITAIIAATIGFLVNKFLDQYDQRLRLEHSLKVNVNEKQMQKDIGDLDISMQQIREELTALKLSVGLRNR